LNPSSPRAPEPSGRFKHAFIRYGIRFFVRCYLRVSLTGVEKLPAAPYIICFSHPNWVDPFLLASLWPEPPRVFIFGPREEDMRVGWKNQLISWTQIAVPFKPSKSNLLDTTRRAVGVLKRGDVLAIAGEGRLSDYEGEIVPLQEGAAYFALRAQVPLVPMAIIGTRWLHFGKRVTMRIGEPLATDDLRADRAGVAQMTERIAAAMNALFEGVKEDEPPGWFGRWLTDLFNNRPWLDDPSVVPNPPKPRDTPPATG
jgi:1-acyl-sn-glycerol-3-phosphate acyltransferase